MRRTLWKATLVAVGLIAGTVLTGYAEAPDPNNGATKPVREQNLDANGWIRVHEQGTTDVNVTNENLSVSGEVSVDNFPSEIGVNNFPATQDVKVVGGSLVPPTVTKHWSWPLTVDPIPAGEDESHSFSVINATTIYVTTGDDDEVNVIFGGPLGVVLVIDEPDGEQESFFYSFTYPVPVDQVIFQCFNESDDCNSPGIGVTGF